MLLNRIIKIMKNLVIVESPTKAKTIGKFLGEGFEMKACMGHVMDLPKSTLGVDIEHDFAPQFEKVTSKKEVISELKKSSKEAENIILATDPDREGEAIAAHIIELLTKDAKIVREFSRNKDSHFPRFKRIVFHEITKEAVEEALKNPRDIDTNLVEAQTARRVLDRLVGYKLSPILWQKVRRGLSAGRVQSIALRLIVEREREVEKFKREKYWTITAVYTTTNKQQLAANKSEVRSQKLEVEFELIEINGQKIEISRVLNLYDGQYKVTKTIIESLDGAKKTVADSSSKEYKISDFTKRETKRSPQPAFTTSTLQQDASRRFGFSGKRTMSLAQKLYEEGFITYHRTDSVSMANQAIFSIRNYVEKQYGGKYLPSKPRFYKTKQKLAQEAHEAIRPTKAGVLGLEIGTQLGKDYAKLYELIWNRAVASQMADALIESSTVLVDSIENKYRFKANGSVLVFDGFLKVNPFGISDTILPEFKVGENIKFENIEEKEHETNPPPRYNDASLIATLEEKGIGRPSTYATIISTIETRQYVEKEEGRFKPTPVGLAVNDFLVENFSTIDDIPFTAEMEDELDQIANGEKQWVPVIKEFYNPFEKSLKEVKDVARVKIETEETDEICPKCGAKLVIRTGRFGKFLSCGTFPKCDFTKALVEETKFTCPECGGKIVFKKTKKGRRFYGCSSYPKCKFAVWKLEDLKKEQKSH
ncbi:MAG: DNA topoisomerase I [Candidatus Levybacteria bacterium RBG_16_35_6]|nr:MAG: DNA topoisomerase I [Candidatus Levybacteria bacterium RBG_16_35_6]